MEVNSAIVKVLECSVCLGTMHPPICICLYGHSFCKWCSNQMKSCPVCKEPQVPGRNYALERVHDELILPCNFCFEGCTFTTLGLRIQEHEQFCDYMTINCPLQPINGCSWIGRVMDVEAHCTEHGLDANHVSCSSKVKEVGSRVLLETPKDSRDSDTYCILFKVHGKLFKCVFHTDWKKRIMRWTVIFLGPRADAKKYQYQLIFVNEKEPADKIIRGMACQPLQISAFEEDKYVKINADLLKNYYHHKGALRWAVVINLAEQK